MELKLSYYGDPVLRKKGVPVSNFDDALKTLVVDMIDTMKKHDGIGLAAPQVGKSLRVFITYVPEKNDEGEYEEGTEILKIYINPEILEYSQETDILNEGCLSIPNIHGDVERPCYVKVKAFDLEGNPFITDAYELEAHCILHENDHINGVLFIDRVRGKERQKLEPLLKRLKQNPPPK